MITSLSIRNFALIDRLSIDFARGFSIITGETGAGKSILLGALGLVLGKRADLSSLKDKEEKCVVEAQFDLAGYGLESFFADNDLDFDLHTIIRREILPSGKSRAFVNDTPINLSELQELGERLIDIHSQHQTRELSDVDFQLHILDAIADNRAHLEAYQSQLSEYRNTHADWRAKTELRQQSLKEQDYRQFLLDELFAANLKPGEQLELEQRQEQLANVETIREQLDRSIALSREDEFGVSRNLREIKQAVVKIAGFSAAYQQLAQRLDSVAIEFDDIASELERAGELLVSDPNALESIGDRLQLIYQLEKKHKVSSIEELLEIQQTLDQQAVSMASLEEEIASLESTLSASAQALNDLAAKLNVNRAKAIPDLIAQWQHVLADLGMPHARFQLDLVPLDRYADNGKDTLSLQFSANKGATMGALNKVASGGELSRIMLATKSILARFAKLPTVIFDEIDTGVSGEIADKMGEIMRDMGRDMQVIAITHLPQIAAKGHDHFKVFKTSEDQRTVTRLERLDYDSRVLEIAQMLSGASVSDSAINHAKALLD